MQTVIVITDEPLIEAGIRATLGQTAGFELLAVYPNVTEFTQRTEARASVILCSLHPETDLALSDLRHASPRSAIAILGREISPEFAHQALECGVRGFISTLAGPELLIECLVTIAHGELWMEKTLSMSLIGARRISLSKRQTQLVRLLAQGLKNKEIASALGIAEGTVKAYLTVLFEKVGAKDRFELALFGLKNLKGFREEARIPRMTVHMRSSPQPRRSWERTAGRMA